jgi:hypothetical protein
LNFRLGLWFEPPAATRETAPLRFLIVLLLLFYKKRADFPLSTQRIGDSILHNGVYTR